MPVGGFRAGRSRPQHAAATTAPMVSCRHPTHPLLACSAPRPILKSISALPTCCPRPSPAAACEAPFWPSLRTLQADSATVGGLWLFDLEDSYLGRRVDCKSVLDGCACCVQTRPGPAHAQRMVRGSRFVLAAPLIRSLDPLSLLPQAAPRGRHQHEQHGRPGVSRAHMLQLGSTALLAAGMPATQMASTVASR